MSSLLQHHGGRSADGKIELICYLVDKGEKWERYNGPDAYDPSPHSTTFTDYREQVELQRKDGSKSMQPALYRFYRKPADMCGCWVGFRYLGEVHYPDLSVPIQLFELPKGAERLTDDEMADYWFTP